MIDHVSIPVADVARAAAFYDAVLATVGLTRRKERAGAIGYGNPMRAAPFFWILAREDGRGAVPGSGLHLSFVAPTRAAVDAFHEAALRHGARDAGAPGLRPEYTQPFYGAFVIDLDGFKVEAVCRREESIRRTHSGEITGTFHGVDGCRGGWVSVSFEPSSGGFRWKVYETILGLLAEGPKRIAIDIPIGLTDEGSRRCDEAARRLLRPFRGSSVFPAPLRCALEAPTYLDACEASRKAHGKALSKQAWQIVPKIREVDELMRSQPDLGDRVHEVHPEISFLLLGGGQPMRHAKKTREGREERLSLLRADFGGVVDEAVSDRRQLRCEVDDILDAFAALWTALRIEENVAQSIPADPPRDRFGLRMEIVA